MGMGFLVMNSADIFPGIHAKKHLSIVEASGRVCAALYTVYERFR